MKIVSLFLDCAVTLDIQPGLKHSIQLFCAITHYNSSGLSPFREPAGVHDAENAKNQFHMFYYLLCLYLLMENSSSSFIHGCSLCYHKGFNACMRVYNAY